jgi:hypothetical protein
MSERSPFYPYPPRPGANPEALIAAAESHQTDLSEAEKQDVTSFEQALYKFELPQQEFPLAAEYTSQQEALGAPMQSLETLWMKKLHETSFGLHYFLTADGKNELKIQTGIDFTGDSINKAAITVASLDTRAIDSKVLDKLEANSIGHEESLATQTFINNGFSGLELPTLATVTTFKNPEVLVEKLRGYRQFKTYLGQLKTDVQGQSRTSSAAVIEAKLLLVDLYRLRINRFIADNYIDAFKILAQYRASNQTQHGQAVADLESILPAFKSTADAPTIASFLQRLDRYRYGVSSDESGAYTWLSRPANELLISADRPAEVAADVSRGAYHDIEQDVLDSTQITGQTFGTLITDVMREYGVLSEHEDWVSERIGPAPDNKWQVIVNDKFKSLAVNDKQRVVKVPAKQTSLAAAIVKANHEIVHVLQHENKRAIGELAIMKSIGLDSASEQTEAGGLWQEKVANELVTGKADIEVNGTGYAKATQVKERGGTYGEVVQAYYEDLKVSNPKWTDKKVAEQSVNRARRIFRAGGFEFAQDTNYVTNTQPVNYLEQQLIYQELNEEQRKMLYVGGVTIANLLRLADHGLVDLRKISIPERMPVELMHPAVKRIIAEQS